MLRGSRTLETHTPALELFRVLRGSFTLETHLHFGAISHAPRIAYPRNAPSLWGDTASSEGRVPLKRTLSFELSSIPRGPCTFETHPQFGAILHAPRVVFPHVAPSDWSYPACSEGRVPSNCTLSLEPSRSLRGWRTPETHPPFGAILHSPRVVCPQNTPLLWGFPVCSEARVPSKISLSLELSRMLRGSRTLETHPKFGAIPHSPRVAYHQITNFGAISHAPRFVYVQLARELFSVFQISFSL